MKKFFSNIFFRIPFIRNTARSAYENYVMRAFAAAKSGRLLADWSSSIASINNDIRSGMSAVRDRARDLWRNNDYVRGYRQRNRTNIVGPEGFSLQCRIKDADGNYDEEKNTIVEEAWKDWGRKENCTMSERYTFREICLLSIDQLKRDGEILMRKVTSPDKKYTFALEPIETDYLDHTYNQELRNGNVVIMGVEMNQWRKPVAYWLIQDMLGEEVSNIYSIGFNHKGKKLVRVSAEEIIHIFDPEHAHQYRGYSHLTQSMITFHNLEGYDQAAIINARAGASKMGFFVNTNDKLGGTYQGDDIDEKGNVISELSAGEIEWLPKNRSFQGWDPKYPDDQYASFVKSILRRMATGLGLAYANWVGDLEAVNFSSMRSGLQDERDQWILQQANFRESFLIPIFEEWLKYALLKRMLPFSYSDYAMLNKPEFVGRRWDWVDPRADVEAVVVALSNNLTTLTYELGKKGIDFNELIRLRKKELEALKEIEDLKRAMNPVKIEPPKGNGNGKSLLKDFVKV